MGALTNIDREGFASVAFHSFPSTLKWDAYSGDYGPNFFGHALNTATYLITIPNSAGRLLAATSSWTAIGSECSRSTLFACAFMLRRAVCG